MEPSTNLILTAHPRVIFEKADARSRNSRRISDQCDCACPHTEPIEILSVPSDPMICQAHPELSLFPVDLEYWAALQPTSAGPVVLDANAVTLLRYFDTPRPVTNIYPQSSTMEDLSATLNDFLKLSLLVPSDFVLPRLTEIPETLSAWIHVTNACNLRCSYCYLNKTQESMNIDIGRRSIEAVFRSAVLHNYKGIQLKFAGGEPTLQMQLIADLHRYAQELSVQHGLVLDSVILSNGTRLTLATMKEIQNAGIHLMISMDGLDGSHDRQRPFLGGQGSAQSVKRVINELLEIDFVPDISVTVSNRNLEGLPALIEWLLKHELPFNLNYYRENGESASLIDLKLDETRMINTMRIVFRIIEANLPRRSLLSSLVDLANLAVPHSRTCSVGHSYLVIDHHGNVAKCQMDIKHPITTILHKDLVAIVQADQTGIHNLSVRDKEQCKTCQWRHWCTGGCPLLAFRATGRFDTKSPNCKIYKTLYPEVIRLEALRLLKYSNEIMAVA